MSDIMDFEVFYVDHCNVNNVKTFFRVWVKTHRNTAAYGVLDAYLRHRQFIYEEIKHIAGNRRVKTEITGKHR